VLAPNDGSFRHDGNHFGHVCARIRLKYGLRNHLRHFVILGLVDRTSNEERSTIERLNFLN
jgi:hypothetical protein